MTVGLVAYRLRRYQEKVLEKLVSRWTYYKAHIVMMPTGTGKTLVEMALARWLVEKRGRVLVVEPTRFLVDQMRPRWVREFGSRVAGRYEGDCQYTGADVVLATPRTALKCWDHWGEWSTLIIDEVHRAPGSENYRQLVKRALEQGSRVAGFSALVSRERLLGFKELVGGGVNVLFYDFRDLEAMGDYTPPYAVAEVFETPLNPVEERVCRDIASRAPVAVGGRLASLAYRLCYRYGAGVACGFLERHGAGSIVEDCGSLAPGGHKSRGVLDVLRVYPLGELSPVLVFTWSVPHALELAGTLGEWGIEARVITGGTPRSARLKLLEDVREGGVEVIVLTSVGEEGIDLPETGLLVLCDTPLNVLRFYQRLGRLLRKGDRRVKYLAVLTTPFTSEVETLPTVLSRLHAEGVDISYIVAGLPELVSKSPSKRIEHIVSEALREQGVPFYPYASLRWGWSPESSGFVLENVLKEAPEVLSLLQKVSQTLGLSDTWDTGDSVHDALLSFYVIKQVRFWNLEKYSLQDKAVLLRELKDDIDRLSRSLKRMFLNSPFQRELEKALEEKRLLLFPDWENLSDMLALLLSLARRGADAWVSRRPNSFHIKEKTMLYLLSYITTPENVPNVVKVIDSHLKQYAENEDSLNKGILRIGGVTSLCTSEFCLLEVDDYQGPEPRSRARLKLFLFRKLVPSKPDLSQEPFDTLYSKAFALAGLLALQKSRYQS